MPQNEIIWHYARTELAEQVMDRFSIGATTALTIFAPRRMGKTEFVLEDLLPMAEVQHDYLTVYVNFRDRFNDPVDSLIFGLQAAGNQAKFNDEANSLLSKFRSAGTDTPVGGASLVVTGAQPTQKLDVVQEMFDAFIADGRRVLLALDDVQHLATDKLSEPLVYSLRGMIDSNRQRVRVIYSGSSRSGLAKLFKRRNAPLFSSSQQIDLPELGRAYIEHVAMAFSEATGRTLRIDECQKAFRMLRKVPFDYRQVTDQLILKGGTDILAATSDYLTANNQDETYLSNWAEMKPVDRTVVQWVITGTTQGIYSQEARAFLAERLGVDQIDTHSIQNAVNRLRRRSHLVPMSQGRYEIEDPYFAEWITYNAKNG